MPTIPFNTRIVFDRAFYDDIKARKFNSRPRVLIKLMRINDRAKGHRRTHNVMSKKIFDKILTDNTNMIRPILRSSFYDFEKEELEQIEDETERNIKIAIDLLNEEPHKTFIFTSEKKLKEYQTNEHFIGVKEIDVKSGEEALAIIDDYFNSCS